jgi:recombination protein U
MVNTGKVFEQDFKKSVPEKSLLIRLPDPPQSFEKRSDTRFSYKNPCDYVIFDTVGKKLYCLELKTTKSKSMSFDDITMDKPQGKLIKKHQIESLLKFSEFDDVIAGLVCNFRDEKNDTQRLYFMNIIDFNKMMREINKSSFNEMDIILHNAVKISGVKKRVHFNWDIDGFFNSYNN